MAAQGGSDAQESQLEDIWKLTSALAGAASPFDVAEVLANQGDDVVGASFANMAVLDQDSNSIHVVHHSSSDETAARWQTFDVSEQLPACEAIDSGLPVLLGSKAEITARFPGLPDSALPDGINARASIPVRDGAGSIMGAVGFGWTTPQEFGARQLRHLDLIAHLVGLSVERAMTRTATSDAVGRLPRFLESMPNGFISVDREFAISYLNVRAEELLDRRRSDVVGTSLFDTFPEAISSGFANQCEKTLQSGGSFTTEGFYSPAGIWIEVHAWSDQFGLNLSFRNIDQRKITERAQVESLNETSTRLSFITDLTSTLAEANTRNEVLERLASAVIPTFADWATVVVPRGDELIRIAALHRDPVVGTLAKRLIGAYPHPFDGPSPGVAVYKSRKPMRVPQLASKIIEDLDDSAASTAYGRTLQLLGDGPGLITPIFNEQEVVAVLTMVRQGRDLYSDSEAAFIAEVAGLAASSMEAARQVEMQRETATALQDAALPKSLPVLKTLDVSACYQAASEGSQVGGDWYDALELPNGKVALVVGDAAGHGLQAAAMMTQMRNVLRAHIFSSTGPAQSLNLLREMMGQQEPEAFGTVLCVEIDQDSGKTVWAAAGHVPPILLRSTGSSELLPGSPQPPIGYSGSIASETHDWSLTLRDGDRLLMFTDGLYEKRRVNIDIGLTHLMITAEQTRNLDPSDACDEMLREMLSESHEDDVCLMVADFNSGNTSS